MPDGAPTATVESIWKRVLEASILFGPVGYALLFAVGGLVTLMPSSGGATGAAAGPGAASAPGMAAGASAAFGLAFGAGLLVMLGLGLLFLALNPIALFLDAEAVNEAGLEWEPSGALYALGSLFLGGLVPLHYLYKRYQHTADGTTHAWAWYLVAQFLVVAPLAAVLAVVVHPVMLTPLSLSVAAFLVGIYRDPVHVRTRSDGWLPNPINWYLGAVFSVALLGVGPLVVAAIYLYKRRKAIGLSEERAETPAAVAD